MNTIPNDRFWTASNMISMLRLLLTIPIAIWLYHERYTWAFVACWIAAGTDWLDGFIARRTNTVSTWGMIIDPIADKVLVGTVVVLLLVQDLLPLWFVGIVVARDVLILAGSLWARKKIQGVLPSLMSGKLAVSAVALTGVVCMVSQGAVLNVLMAISCVLMGVSLWQYTMRIHGLIR